jgi:predicted nucleic acid-binding protein
MLCEMLQGLDSERAAQEVEALLRRFAIVPMVGDPVAVTAGRNCRSLRRRGITVRKTIDLPIGTWCTHCFAMTKISSRWRDISG